VPASSENKTLTSTPEYHRESQAPYGVSAAKGCRALQFSRHGRARTCITIAFMNDARNGVKKFN